MDCDAENVEINVQPKNIWFKFMFDNEKKDVCRADGIMGHWSFLGTPDYDFDIGQICEEVSQWDISTGLDQEVVKEALKQDQGCFGDTMHLQPCSTYTNWINWET